MAAKLRRELDDFMARKAVVFAPTMIALTYGQEKETMVLKVSWKRSKGNCDFVMLQKLFERFGKVEDMVICSKKNKGSVVVVMS